LIFGIQTIGFWYTNVVSGILREFARFLWSFE